MITESKWIEKIQKYLFGKTNSSFRTLPCFESTNQNVRRQIIYPRPVVEGWLLHGCPASFNTINFQIETNLTSGFCLEKFRLSGEIDEEEFFILLRVNHKIKVWILDDDLFHSDQPERKRIGELLYPIIRCFVEEYSSKRLQFLTETYEEVGTPEEQKG